MGVAPREGVMAPATKRRTAGQSIDAVVDGQNPSGRGISSSGSSRGGGGGGGCKFSKRDVLKLKQVFAAHDTNGDNQVTLEEFERGLRGTSLQDDTRNCTGMFKQVDINDDHVLTFYEYLKSYYKYASNQDLQIMMEWAYPSEDKARILAQEVAEATKTFHLFNKNENGCLGRWPLKEMGYTAEEVEYFINTYGSDAAGLYLLEFIEMTKHEYLQDYLPKSPKTLAKMSKQKYLTKREQPHCGVSKKP